jgi:hypothetical protein
VRLKSETFDMENVGLNGKHTKTPITICYWKPYDVCVYSFVLRPSKLTSLFYRGRPNVFMYD